MFYLQTINQVNLLTIVCFSFLIMVFTLAMNRGERALKLLGALFFIPFVLVAYSFFKGKMVTSAVVFTWPEILLALSLSALTFFNLERRFNLTNIVIFSIPLALILILPSRWLLAVWGPNEFYVYPALAAIVPAAYFLFTRDNSERKLYFAICLLLFANVLQFAAHTRSLQVLVTGMRLIAYFTFFMHFFAETYNRLMQKVIEADKKMASLEKSIKLEVKKRTFEIELSNQTLLNMVKTDGLTKAYNKATIMNIMEKMMLKRNMEFSIFIFDIDDFKRINDTLGHVAGDMALKKLATIAKKAIRDVDSLGRYGGDEFIVVLPNTNISDAIMVAERFRKLVEASDAPRFSVSIGVAAYPHDADTVKGLIAAADEGLYRSKRKGKNAVSHRVSY